MRQKVKQVEVVEARKEMLEDIALHTQLVSEQIRKEALSGSVMEAMATVPRDKFVLDEMRIFAYLDRPLPIGYGKTISQPFMVALMTDLLQVQPDDRVLDVGTGLGYQAAILAKLAKHVYSMDIIDELAKQAAERLEELGYQNVDVRTGDGRKGWASEAPFDKVLVAAAPELIPPALLEQLKPGGKMVIPSGLPGSQQLMLVEKNAQSAINTTEILPVLFSPLILVH